MPARDLPKTLKSTRDVANASPGAAKKPVGGQARGGANPSPTESTPPPTGPALDPHHLQLVQVGKSIKMIKYDKHPNLKKRRDYKDMLTVECLLECIEKEHEKRIVDEIPDQ